MSISLLRAPVCPDKAGDAGEHTFTYSYFPHEGTWQEAGTVRAALSLNQPVLSVRASAHKGVRPASDAFVSFDFPSLVIDALKPAQDGDGLILRVYESEARRGNAGITVHLPVTRVTECNLMEEDETELPVENGRFSFAVKPFEVRTFRLR